MKTLILLGVWLPFSCKGMLEKAVFQEVTYTYTRVSCISFNVEKVIKTKEITVCRSIYLPNSDKIKVNPESAEYQRLDNFISRLHKDNRIPFKANKYNPQSFERLMLFNGASVDTALKCCINVIKAYNEKNMIK